MNCQALDTESTVNGVKGEHKMPKGPNGEKRPADAIGCAVMVGRIATGEQDDATYVSPNRRKSGVAGGLARASRMSTSERSAAATKAAAVRYQPKEGAK